MVLRPFIARKLIIRAQPHFNLQGCALKKLERPWGSQPHQLGCPALKKVATYHSHLIGPLSMPTLESFDQLLVIHNAHFIIDTKFVNLGLHKIEKVTS